jgi:NNP family nitrate/nitrite transporter-like MFS transporter
LSERQRVSIQGTASSALTAATVGFFFGFAAVALFGPTAKEFKDLLALSPAAVGLLVAAPNLSGSLLRIPFSAWVDADGGRRPFIWLMSLSVVGMTGLALLMVTKYPDELTVGYYPLLLVLGVLSGAGVATFSVGISQVSYWFPQGRQGWALGTYAGAGNLAPGIFSFLIPVVLDSWGLSTAYVLWLVFLVVGLGIYVRTGRNAPFFQLRAAGADGPTARAEAADRGQELFPAGNMRDTLRISAANPKTWMLVGLYFTTFGGFLALTAWFPTYWQELHGTTLFVAGVLTATYSILASLVRIGGGAVADRIGGEPTALISLTVMLAGALLLTVSTAFVVAFVGAIAMAVGMGVNNAAVFKLVPQEVPEAVGGAAGWVGGLGAFGGFAVPPLMGAFVTEGVATGYARGFAVFMVLAVVSLGLAAALRRTRGRSLRTPTTTRAAS